MHAHIADQRLHLSLNIAQGRGSDPAFAFGLLLIPFISRETYAWLPKQVDSMLDFP